MKEVFYSHTVAARGGSSWTHIILCARILLKRIALGVLMNYADFIKELRRASLTVRAFADLVRMNRNSVSNYAQGGEVPAHLGIIATLLAELHAREIDYGPVVERAAPAGKKPRGLAKVGRFGGQPQRQLE